MNEKERYATVIGRIEWEIDLERKMLISTKDPKIQRKLNRKEMIHLKKLIRDKNNDRKNEM